jgi:hypothetical protein
MGDVAFRSHYGSILHEKEFHTEHKKTSINAPYTTHTQNNNKKTSNKQTNKQTNRKYPFDPNNLSSL